MVNAPILTKLTPTKLINAAWLPFIGLCFAVMWSLLFDFDASTSTHCRVANYLPTVSAAIALTPQAYIWKTCIYVHTPPRYFILWLFKGWYAKRKVDDTKLLAPFYKGLVLTTLTGNFIEVSGLLGLSVISSKDNADFHEFCFILFVSGALTCMLASCLISTVIIKSSVDEENADRRKLRMCILNFVSFAVAVHFYFRHNKYCEPGVYTMFSLCEYIVVLSNIAFHCAAFRAMCSTGFTLIHAARNKLD